MKNRIKNMTKRLFAVMLALMLAMPVLPAAEAAPAGNGTAADPYLITTPAQLQSMEENLSAHYRLAADVDMKGMEFRPVGNETAGAFTGSFDGGGYTISNLTVEVEGGKYVGLIGYCEGSVTNVVMENVSVTGTRYVGALAGYCVGGTLTDCSVSGTVLASSGLISAHAGGLVGELGEKSTLTNCSFAGSVCAKGTGNSVQELYAGGLVGELGGESALTNCAYSGSVSLSKKSYNDQNYDKLYSGGLVGKLGEKSAITDCSAEGSVVLDTDYGYKDYDGTCWTGGLAGFTGKVLKVSDCSAETVITGSGSEAEIIAGGLVGYSSDAVFENCAFNGKFKAESAGGRRNYGGIVGSCGGDSAIKNCVNYAGINVGSDDDWVEVGGIAGFLNGTVTGCRNYGDLSGDYAGGIVKSSSNAVIKDCENYGKVFVSGTGTYAGGIICYAESTLVIERCKNYGEVASGDSDPDGLSGIAGSSANYTEITDCSNYGDIIGATAYAAGIVVTWEPNDNIFVTGCSNYGNVLAESTSAGIVVDDNFAGEAEIKRCYNAGSTQYGIAYLWYCDESGLISESVSTGPCSYFAYVEDNDYYDDGYEFIDCVSTSQFEASTGSYVTNAYNFICYESVSPTINSESHTLEELRQTEQWKTLDFEDVWQVDEKYSSGLPMLRNLPEQLVLNELVLILVPGESASLSAYWQGKQTQVTWDSTDNKVAKVDNNGIVTAVSNGKCWISAELPDGTRTNCVVHVVTQSDSLSLPESAAIEKVGATITLTPEVSEGSNETFQWSSSDSSVATVSSAGVVKGIGAGTAVITVTAYPSLQSASCTVSVSAPVTKLSITSAASVNVGETVKPTVTTTPKVHTSKLVWSSSDESIAVVENGIVTGVAPGQTIITVTAEGLSAVCVVTVLQPATELVLAQTSVELEVGMTAQMQLTVNPENSTDAITWSSNKTTIASVDKNGVVTAKKAGSALITAKAASGVSAYCTVTVKAKPLAVTGLDITKMEAELQVGEFVQLAASVTPSNATDKSVTWTSSDENVATVSTTGCVTAVGAGQAVITATAANGLYDTCTVTVRVPSSAAFEVGSARVSVGEEVEVPVFIHRNPGIAAFTLSVEYDSATLIPVGVEAGELLSGGVLTSNADSAAQDGTLRLTWYHTQNVTGNGLAFTLRFRAADTAGTENISLNFGENDICDSNKISVNFGVQNGQVTILDCLLGDIYPDRAVNMKDIVYFARWFNGQETMDEEQMLAADLYFDNVLDVRDLTVLAQMLSESIDGNEEENDLAPMNEQQISLMSLAPTRQSAPFAVKVSNGTLRSGKATLTVRGENCPGIASFRFWVEVPEGYEVETVRPTALTETGTFSYNSDTGIVAWYHTENQCLDGDLFTITLRAKSDAVGVAQVDLSYSEDDFFAAGVYENIAVEVSSGKVLLRSKVEVQDVSLDGTDLSVEVLAEETVDCKVLAAFYSEERFIWSTLCDAQVTGEKINLDVTLPEEWDVCKVFIVDTNNWGPLCMHAELRPET